MDTVLDLSVDNTTNVVTTFTVIPFSFNLSVYFKDYVFHQI